MLKEYNSGKEEAMWQWDSKEAKAGGTEVKEEGGLEALEEAGLLQEEQEQPGPGGKSLVDQWDGRCVYRTCHRRLSRREAI